MSFTKEEREELTKVSQECFGRPSLWMKFYRKGVPSGSTTKYFFNKEALIAYMQNAKAKADEFLAKMKADGMSVNGINK